MGSSSRLKNYQGGIGQRRWSSSATRADEFGKRGGNEEEKRRKEARPLFERGVLKFKVAGDHAKLRSSVQSGSNNGRPRARLATLGSPARRVSSGKWSGVTDSFKWNSNKIPVFSCELLFNLPQITLHFVLWKRRFGSYWITFRPRVFASPSYV